MLSSLDGSIAPSFFVTAAACVGLALGFALGFREDR